MLDPLLSTSVSSIHDVHSKVARQLCLKRVWNSSTQNYCFEVPRSISVLFTPQTSKVNAATVTLAPHTVAIKCKNSKNRLPLDSTKTWNAFGFHADCATCHTSTVNKAMEGWPTAFPVVQQHCSLSFVVQGKGGGGAQNAILVQSSSVN